MLGECHVLVHPSLHDSGGFVILEAMAARPVICLNLGGPATQVTEATGYKIAASERAIDGWVRAMTRLAADPEHLSQMGQAGQSRVREYYHWSAKGEFFSELYHRVLPGRSEQNPTVLAGSKIG